MHAILNDREPSASAISSLLQAETVTLVKSLFAAFVRPFGFNAFAAGEPPTYGDTGKSGPPPFLMLEWPQAWLELYAREGFAQDDIVVEEAANRDVPFTWAEIQSRRPGSSHRIFAAAAQFGWVDGFVVPIARATDEGHKRGVMSLASVNRLRLSPAERFDLIEISQAAYERARILRDQRSHGDHLNLSPLTARERQVMDLVCQGFDDAGIAGALGISPRTAHFHVENAKKRLGASNRAQAAAMFVKQER